MGASQKTVVSSRTSTENAHAPLRIAHLVQKFPSLSETFVLSQITGLIDLGHEVDIYAWGTSTAPHVHEDVVRYRLLDRTRYLQPPTGMVRRLVEAPGRIGGTGAWREPRSLLRTLDIARHGRIAASLTLFYGTTGLLGAGAYDLVHCQFGTLGARALALRTTGVARGKLVVSFRGADLMRGRRRDGYRPLFEAADLILPVSRTFADLLATLGCPEEKIRVLRSGIPIRHFPFRERTREASESTRVLMVGRLIEKKGAVHAIEAAARLKGSGHSVRFSIAGDGPLKDELRRRIEDLRLERDVQLLGARTRAEVSALIADAHLLIAPSVTAADGDQEGIPNTLKEGMAAGLPVVSTLHSAIPELVEHGRSGFLVPEGDSEALAERIGWLIENPGAWPEMGRVGRARVEADYDIEKLSRRLAALYREALDG